MAGSGADGETWSCGYACQWKHTCSRTTHLLRSCLRDLDARLYCLAL